MGSVQKCSRGAMGSRGFSLAELLVVIGIIAAVSVISLPAIRGLGRSNTMTSAAQQLLDDLALARYRAIVGRTTVHVVFVPEYNQIQNRNVPGMNDADKKLFERLKTGSQTTYALYAERTVGDQPGQRTDRYLTDWRSLPDGVFIATDEFRLMRGPPFDRFADVERPFAYSNTIPFPRETTPLGNNNIPLMRIAFDQNGSLLQYEGGFESGTRVYRTEYIHLAQGSVFTARNDRGGITEFSVREAPPGNSTNNYHRIRIDPLSGRARLERQEIR